MRKLRLLIVDSDPNYTSNIYRTLSESREIEIIGAESDGVKGLRHICSAHPDVVLMDIQLPGMDGISVLKETRLLKDAPVIIICTRFYSDFCIVNAQQNGAAYILYKPIDYHSLNNLICDCYKSVHTDAYRRHQKTQQRTVQVDNAYRIRSLLFDMGMPSRFVGCMYLVESVLMAVENRMLLGNLSKGLYAEMAKRLKTTPGSIERSLRNAISTTYERGTLSKVFDHRPTNKQFLMYLLNTLNDMPTAK